MLINSSI